MCLPERIIPSTNHPVHGEVGWSDAMVVDGVILEVWAIIPVVDELLPFAAHIVPLQIGSPDIV